MSIRSQIRDTVFRMAARFSDQIQEMLSLQQTEANQLLLETASMTRKHQLHALAQRAKSLDVTSLANNSFDFDTSAFTCTVKEFTRTNRLNKADKPPFLKQRIINNNTFLKKKKFNTAKTLHYDGRGEALFISKSILDNKIDINRFILDKTHLDKCELSLREVVDKIEQEERERELRLLEIEREKEAEREREREREREKEREREREKEREKERAKDKEIILRIEKIRDTADRNIFQISRCEEPKKLQPPVLAVTNTMDEIELNITCVEVMMENNLW